MSSRKDPPLNASHHSKLAAVAIRKPSDHKIVPSESPRQVSKDFILDCCNVNKSRLPRYSDVSDEFLKDFFERPAFKKQLEKYAAITSSNKAKAAQKHTRNPSTKNETTSNTDTDKLPEIAKKVEVKAVEVMSKGKTERFPRIPHKLVHIYLSSKEAMQALERKKKKHTVRSLSGEGLRQLIERYKERVKKLGSPIKCQSQCLGVIPENGA